MIGLAGWSGARKTTVLTRAIPHLREGGLRVSVIKHAHHKFDVDVPGKDSWRHRLAAAEEVLVVAVETDLPTAHLDDIPAVATMMRRLAVSIRDVSALAAAEKLKSARYHAIVRRLRLPSAAR